jgi:hypothetical protein
MLIKPSSRSEAGQLPADPHDMTTGIMIHQMMATTINKMEWVQKEIKNTSDIQRGYPALPAQAFTDFAYLTKQCIVAVARCSYQDDPLRVLPVYSSSPNGAHREDDR